MFVNNIIICQKCCFSCACIKRRAVDFQSAGYKLVNRLLYSAFRARYGIDLTRERLHWFAFLAMLGDIGGCSLSDIIGIRGTDLSKLNGEQRNHYAKMQERYRIKEKVSEAELARIAEFEETLKG